MAGAWTITTGSRLHFGPLAWKPSRGRDFGGWGVMLETPRTVVRVGEIDALSPPPRTTCRSHSRSAEILRRLQGLASRIDPPQLFVEVLEEPPAHCGFGSGTQLALAIAAGMAKIGLEHRPPAPALALLAGRGLRSAVGIHGFDLGGLIVDAGKLPVDAVGELAAHAPVPADWRFILVRPGAAVGLTGDKEAAAFDDLPPFSDSLTDRLREIVFDEVVPAVERNECARFAVALDEYGMLVGEAFRPCQGGVVHPAALPIWTALRDRGLRGIAQTSWGPTLAIVRDNPSDAELTAAVVREVAPSADIQIASPRNVGVEITS